MPVPAVYPFRGVRGGRRFYRSYGSNISLLFERSADFVRRILKGENHGDLPIQQATKFDVIINLKAAANLGLTLPAAVLARADEVIEERNDVRCYPTGKSLKPVQPL